MAYIFEDVFLMHLSKNEYGIHGTAARHENILHLIDIKRWSYDAFDGMLNDLHDVVQQF